MLKFSDLQKIGKDLGADKLGVSSVEPIQADHLNEWLNRGYHGEMSYMENHKEKRLDPAELLPDAKSVVSIFVNYHQPEPHPKLDGVISKYARGKDYHSVLKDIIHELAHKLHGDLVTGLTRKEKAKLYRVFVDSAPVMEKDWAVNAGIGWQGKHSNIITREYGSWGFLGEIITTESFDTYSRRIPDYCGSCIACIEACPTQAITEPYVVDGSKCISYATIELAPEMDIPDEIRSNMEDWIFGCDICQDVCPWNRFAKASRIADFTPIEALGSEGVPDFNMMEPQQFTEVFASTPLNRPGLPGLQRNQDIKRQ